MAIPLIITRVWLDSDPLVNIEVDCPFGPDWKTSSPETNWKTSTVSIAPEFMISCLVIIILLIPSSEYAEVFGVLLIVKHGTPFLFSHSQSFKLSALELDIINSKKITILNSIKFFFLLTPKY